MSQNPGSHSSDWDLVEIQPAAPASSRQTSGTSGTHPPLRPIGSTPVVTPRRVSVPISQIDFLGPESALQLDRGILESPLIYATPGVLHDPRDPSLVEFGLPVGRRGVLPGQEPPAWPTYRSLSSAQRSYYLDWLIGGRRSELPLAYVSLYLYGLERRVLVDGQDHAAIADELIRLLSCYGTATAFRRDAGALLWLTIDLSGPAEPLARSTVDAAIAATTDWRESSIRHCLATFAQRGWDLPAALARLIANQDPRCANSAALNAHPEVFQNLFDLRFHQRFPAGLRLQTSGRAERIEYLIINPTLARLPRSEVHLTARLRVSADCPDLLTLVEIWGQSLAELKAYDRAHRAAESGVITAEMWEALPEISRGNREHPESDAWYGLIQAAHQKHGRPLIAISELAAVKHIEQRGRLTKKQSEQLLKTATHLQLAIEPDARLTEKNYAWDDVVAVFPRRDATPEDLATYQAAAILLRLGMNIAAADGDLDETELERITTHLEQQFEFSSTAADRLEHLRYALIHSPAARGQVEKSLQEKLPLEHRQIVGEFLVGIAVADGTISAPELKALKKGWQALGLESKSLESLLQQPESVASDAQQSLVLDQARISQIMQDTQRVAEMLKQAMRIEDEEAVEEEPEPMREASPDRQAAPVSDVPVPLPIPSPVAVDNNPDWPDLPPRFHQFLRLLLKRPSWARRELDTAAREHQLMLGGALEAINEWAQEHHGDWLTSEEGNEIHVQVTLL